MHFVQIFILLASPPPTSTMMLLRFISQRLRVWRFEWLTALPVAGPLPQQSQNLDIFIPPLKAVVLQSATE
jgi:hypothetical protein